jgi:hypothetical protein
MAVHIGQALTEDTTEQDTLMIAGNFLPSSKSQYADERIERLNLYYNKLGTENFRKVNTLLDIICDIIG